MEGVQDAPPVIGLPERLDRRMRLGPFPSSRDALKFVSYAAAGALLSPFTSPWLWLPIVAAGFAFSVWRPDGQAVDERAVVFLVWRVRSLGCWRTAMTAPPLVRQGLLQLSSHHYVAVVRTSGTPVAYLPPEELGRRFDLYRELLRSMEGSFTWLAATVPIRAQAVVPGSREGTPEETRASSGYSELVSVLCRRRLLRRVYFVLGTVDPNPDAIGRLEGRVALLTERLAALGLRPVRLRDRTLAEAVHRFGWSVEAS